MAIVLKLIDQKSHMGSVFMCPESFGHKMQYFYEFKTKLYKRRGKKEQQFSNRKTNNIFDRSQYELSLLLLNLLTGFIGGKCMVFSPRCSGCDPYTFSYSSLAALHCPLHYSQLQFPLIVINSCEQIHSTWTLFALI